jgi:hypothetical protein
VRWERRYVSVPWGDIAPGDLQPQGEPDTVIEYRHETHVGLYVKGEHVAYLAMLAVRCESKGMDLVPISMAIADTPILVDTTRTVRTRRIMDVDHWREEGA